jgi:hypothetical protein
MVKKKKTQTTQPKSRRNHSETTLNSATAVGPFNAPFAQLGRSYPHLGTKIKLDISIGSMGCQGRFLGLELSALKYRYNKTKNCQYFFS